jgi:DNA-cytosine methyltransferase
MKVLSVLSVFDGISGCRQALKELNIDCEYYASEIDKYAIQVAKANHPDIIQLGEVKNMYTDYTGNPPWQILRWGESGDMRYTSSRRPFHEESEFDLMVGGFPCQSFSIAGNRKGLEDDRGQLFFELLRILKEVKPKYFLFENVASMSKDNQAFISEKLGVEPIMINSDRFVQQNRERLYWTNIDINELPKRPDWEGNFYQWRRTHFRKNKSGVCPALTANMGIGGHNVPLKSEDLKDKLSVKECERLQGFPDNYTDGVSSTQRYKALGNSFTVPVIKHILQSIKNK